MNISKSLSLVGNEPAVFFLQKTVALAKAEPLSGTYILAGLDTAHKHQAAHWLVASLACQNFESGPCLTCTACQQLSRGLYPDLYEVNLEPDKHNISIEQIKELIQKLSLSAFISAYRFVLINNAESLSPSAANALLKTLEEPSARIVIILDVADISQLPLTIASRSQIINFRPVATDKIYQTLISQNILSTEQARIISKLVTGRVGETDTYLANDGLLQERLHQAQTLVTLLQGDLNDKLSYSKDRLGAKQIKESGTGATALLDIWQAVLRDLLLLKFNLPQLAQHEAEISRLQELLQQFQPNRILKALDLIAQTKKYLSAKVNTQLALENVLINI